MTRSLCVGEFFGWKASTDLEPANFQIKNLRTCGVDLGSFHFLEDYPGEVAETKNHKFLNKLELHTPNPSRLTTLQRASNRKFRLQSSPAQKDDAAVHF